MSELYAYSGLSDYFEYYFSDSSQRLKCYGFQDSKLTRMKKAHLSYFHNLTHLKVNLSFSSTSFYIILDDRPEQW